jgi:hypothetical protein
VIHAWILALLACSPQVGSRGFGSLELELEGPIERVLVRGAGPPATEILLHVPAGGRRSLDVPLAFAPLPGTEARVELVEPGTGRVRAGRAAHTEWERAWEDLPAGLRLRARPPMTPVAPRPGLAPLVILLASLAAALGLRRTAPRSACAAVLVGAACLGWVPLGQGAASAPLASNVVFEGHGESGAWLRVHGAVGELRIPVEGSGAKSLPLRVEVDPRDAEVSWSVVEDERGRVLWIARSSRARIFAIEAEPDVGSLSQERNACADLDRSWSRSADGRWTAHGAWPRGTALPEARASAEAVEEEAGQPSAAPPGWLASGLPQGVPVLLGRLAPPSGTVPGSTRSWVRWIGF